ncbi:uncharacterized protein Nmlp_2744 [Natronomonas moolapensis 8.8.11]|uniref:Uncharacterized protein n=1 Tax=Natronomonas moolapensis (strain DSM 18674 / CECT 7526 / JCM 14361 / 8.8.11) TaxID=268739 RepID=M1Y314_NATM8|nr:NUDIX domain-containing protein [Natronomonas moolapensis]CCQ36897.1 uncharacterized protein Nmlp_2744 [Natronomonas moolapensis 8.8.11]
MSIELRRHVSALVSDFAAAYGEVDLVRRRVECGPAERDAVVDSFESFGVVGGAGVLIVRDGAVLLARYERADGWIEPGAGRRPGESYTDCAKRGVRETAGTEAAIEGLAGVQLVYLDDPTDRPPVPNPYVAFRGSIAGGAPVPDADATATETTGSEPNPEADGVRTPGDDPAATGGPSVTPDGTPVALRWAEELPERLAYDQLSELPLGGRGEQHI